MFAFSIPTFFFSVKPNVFQPQACRSMFISVTDPRIFTYNIYENTLHAKSCQLQENDKIEKHLMRQWEFPYTLNQRLSQRAYRPWKACRFKPHRRTAVEGNTCREPTLARAPHVLQKTQPKGGFGFIAKGPRGNCVRHCVTFSLRFSQFLTSPPVPSHHVIPTLLPTCRTVCLSKRSTAEGFFLIFLLNFFSSFTEI